MAISSDDVLHVARLANLSLSDEEVARMSEQLSGILEHVAALSSPDLHCFLRTRPEAALAEADALDAAGPKGLQGVPIALKDILCVRGEETTAGSRILAGHRPLYDAGAVTRCRDAGLIALGKTNMDEFAMGSSTEHSAFGPTRNPWDHELVPGGSSGGSAAAVAAG